MSSKSDLIEQLRVLAGTPSEMAAVAGVEASDATFRRAVKELEEMGVLVAEGTGARNRTYRNTTVVPRELSPRKARICPKCLKRNFGDLEWICPEHEIAEDQGDHPYFGRMPSLPEEVTA